MSALNPVLDDTLSKAAEEKLFQHFRAKMTQIKTERAEAVQAACPALSRLCGVMQTKGGQALKLRALLFSLWNGKPASLAESLGLDWDIKKDFVAVLLAFGDDSFFYDAMPEQIARSGLWSWFIQESEPSSEATP